MVRRLSGHPNISSKHMFDADLATHVETVERPQRRIGWKGRPDLARRPKPSWLEHLGPEGAIEIVQIAAHDQVCSLEELYRVSVPDTILVLTCPPATSEIPYRIYTALFGGHGEGPHRFPPSRRVKKMFECSGWKLIHHRGTVLIPVGPSWLRNQGELMMKKFQKTWISELGIRQVYVCKK